ncbi:hypothetical protein J5N97_009996 [Dioscorea zingiberensis]|uniref:Uncharacterized protein n=1 Tax=Dioscorea zingiberensis TaxID=325984 RepID=A0A9D5CXY2_9LILI|nr:hypothetical protein J5N97_009996 [Dioscorea zingiberensis]
MSTVISSDRSWAEQSGISSSILKPMEDGKVVDINEMSTTLEPDTSTRGGLSLPNKDRLTFRPPRGKSTLGLDKLASAKRVSNDKSSERGKFLFLVQ